MCSMCGWEGGHLRNRFSTKGFVLRGGPCPKGHWPESLALSQMTYLMCFCSPADLQWPPYAWACQVHKTKRCSIYHFNFKKCACKCSKTYSAILDMTLSIFKNNILHCIVCLIWNLFCSHFLNCTMNSESICTGFWSASLTKEHSL